jgi:hypothetical protein
MRRQGSLTPLLGQRRDRPWKTDVTRGMRIVAARGQPCAFVAAADGQYLSTTFFYHSFAM